MTGTAEVVDETPKAEKEKPTPSCINVEAMPPLGIINIAKRGAYATELYRKANYFAVDV